MKKTGIIIAISFIAVLVIGGLIYSRMSYKICRNCDADEFFTRGIEYTCSDKEKYRQTGLEFINTAAGQGHVKAELTLAEVYSDKLPKDYILTDSEQLTCLRRVVTPDQATGLNYFAAVTKAVEQGHELDAVTLSNLGVLYLNGVIPTDNPMDKAVGLFKKAAEAGSFSAMRLLGKLADERGDYSDAMEWFTRASEDPAEATAPLMIGDYYFYGKGTTADYQKAEEWYKKALARSEKSDAGVKDMALTRLDLVQRRLSGPDGSTRQQVAVNYHIDGTVKHFMIFAADHPGEYIGEVINDGSSITAVMNKNLEFTAQLPELQQNDFSSMNEGMFWILNTFAANTHDNAADLIFNFVLTRS